MSEFHIKCILVNMIECETIPNVIKINISEINVSKQNYTKYNNNIK